MKRLIALILFIAVAALGLSFAVLNSAPVQFNYYFGSLEAPLSLIVVLAIACGAILGFIASLGVALTQRREVARYKRKANLAEQEIRNLRQIPIKD